MADAERYLIMQELRYGDNLTYKLDVPAEVLNMSVPADAVLSAAERSVCFGLSAGRESLEVLISARKLGRRLQLEVSDNLTSDILPMEELMVSPFQNNSETFWIACRLESVRDRLAARYGQSGGLTISAGPESGSVYRISCPLNLARDS